MDRFKNLPWSHKPGISTIWDAQGKFVGDVWHPDVADGICKAVNSHASLTEAVRVLTEALENIAQDCEADYPPSHGAIKHAARAALTTAKELLK